MGALEAFVVGLVGGVADFLPVGGSGHRILVGQALFRKPYDRGFAGACEVASALAAIVAFRKELRGLLIAAMRRENGTNVEGRRVGAMLLVAAVTTTLISLPFRDAYLGFSGNLLAVVGVLLLVTGLLLYVGEELGRRTRSLASINTAESLLIGLLQVLAVLPGISRPGMVISGGMLVGMTRESSTRLALLLSIPLLVVTGIWDIFAGQSSAGVGTVALGTTASFVGGFLAIGFLRWCVREFSLMFFAYYLWILGIVAIAYDTLT